MSKFMFLSFQFRFQYTCLQVWTFPFNFTLLNWQESNSSILNFAQSCHTPSVPHYVMKIALELGQVHPQRRGTRVCVRRDALRRAACRHPSSSGSPSYLPYSAHRGLVDIFICVACNLCTVSLVPEHTPEPCKCKQGEKEQIAFLNCPDKYPALSQ